jgi:hypothetical protein
VSDAIEELVANVVDCGFDALPAGAVDGAKRAVLDALAATMAGSTAPGVVEIVATLAEAGGRRLIEAAASLDDLADATELVRLLRPA